MTIKLYFEEALERREYKDIKDCVILMVLSCVPVHIVAMIVGRIFFCEQENVVKCKLFEDNILSVVCCVVAEAGNNVVPTPGGRSVQQFKHIRQVPADSGSLCLPNTDKLS